MYLDAGKAIEWADASPLLQIAGEVGRSVRGQTDLHIAPPDAALFAEAPDQAWQAFYADIALRLDGKEIVLLIDNADRAHEGWLSAFVHAGSLMVLAARERTRLTRILPDTVIAPPALSIGPLDHDAADELVKALVTPHVQIDPWAVRRILELTSNQPHYIRLFCHTMLDCCVNKALLTPTDVEETLAQLLDTPLAEFSEAWQALDFPEQYVLALMGSLRGYGGIATQYDIQKESARHDRTLVDHDIVAWVEVMVERGLLERLGANSYRFTVELFRLWLRHNHPPEEVSHHRVGPIEWPRLGGIAERLKREFVRRRMMWISVGIVLLVAVVFALQPAVRRNVAHPAPTAAATATAQALPVGGTPVSFVDADADFCSYADGRVSRL